MKNTLLIFTFLYSLCASAQVFINAEVMQPQCFGDLGAISTNPTGGIAPYSYQWSTGANTSGIDNLPAGIYSLTVTDNIGNQTWESWTINIANTPLVIDANIQDPLCNSASGIGEGSIEVLVTGGIGPYEYAWSDFVSNSNIFYGPEGSYTVTVTDFNGCTATGEWELTEPTPIVINMTIDQPDCHHTNGALDGGLDITATGGAGSYTYYWEGPNVGTYNEDQSGLGEGDYIVEVTDGNGCTSTISAALSEPTMIELHPQVTQSSCEDGVYVPGEIKLYPTGGRPPYSYFWSNGLIEPIVSDLEIGTYTVTVTDHNGCTNSFTTDIDTDLEELEVSFIQENISCDGSNALGAIDLSVSGGTLPYTYAWSGNTMDPNSEDQSGLEEGTYNVTVGDADGCQYVTLEFDIITEGVPQAPDLCLVTNDNPQGYNTLYWESDESNGEVAYYNVYREGDVSEEFEIIGTVSVDQENTFVDEEALSSQQAYRYFVKAVNSCDVESEPSDIHKTIHLTINQGTNGNINLIWDEYIGVSYEQVTIYRGDSPDNLTEYITLPGNIFSFTDLKAIEGTSYYQIGLTLSIPCDIAKGTYELRSNIAENVINSLSEVDWIETIYPNPFEQKLHVVLDHDATIEFMDVDGRLLMRKNIYQGHNTIETNVLGSGMYFVRLTSGNKVSTWRGFKY